MTIDILIKSGFGGWFDEDGCDFLLKRYENINDVPIPRIGETVKLFEFTDKKRPDGNLYKRFNEYHVIDVEYLLGDYSDDFNYAVKIYVVPIGRTPNY